MVEERVIRRRRYPYERRTRNERLEGRQDIAGEARLVKFCSRGVAEFVAPHLGRVHTKSEIRQRKVVSIGKNLVLCHRIEWSHFQIATAANGDNRIVHRDLRGYVARCIGEPHRRDVAPAPGDVKDRTDPTSIGRVLSHVEVKRPRTNISAGSDD